MKIIEFNKLVENQLEYCKKILINKGIEYAPNSKEENNIDRLAHFKRTANFLGVNNKEALFAMLSKHLISISDMCKDDNKYSIEKWDEKITDSINYLILLKAIIMEDNNE